MCRPYIKYLAAITEITVHLQISLLTWADKTIDAASKVVIRQNLPYIVDLRL
jgi:hypothetical protein